MREMRLLKTSPISPAAAAPAVSAETLPGIDYWCVPDTHVPLANVLTVDLEDWPIAVLGPEHEVTGRVVENTLRCLQILRWHNVKATFFVLTKVAQQFGDLIREVHAAGHEIASHGHGHELLTSITPDRFADDVRRSIDILTDLVGRRPVGYRAPGFSIVESTRWAGPILADLGFKYSSSVFPISHRRYGIPKAPRGIHRWDNCRLIECPPATYAFARRNLPVAGGGYFRLLPGAIARLAIRRINHHGMPAVLYMHPYELDIDGIGEHKLAGVKVGWWRHLTQSLFRDRMEGRMHRLLEASKFTTMQDLLRDVI
jgi:polysaccharide deacetylase family protein (PEP-CTERM system associated)